jgi:hypothetical protein
MSFFVGRSWSELLNAGVVALSAGDAVLAKRTFDELQTASGSYGPGAVSLSSAWDPFVALLGRRGYFVASLGEIQIALEEIEALGEGFDLYDLALSLSRCDTALALHLNAPSARAFPELVMFARRGTTP